MSVRTGLMTAASLAVTFVAGAFFGASLPDSWADVGGWIYNFQALLAGFLAVFAAVLTIWQMMRIDREHERRHAQQIRVATAERDLAIDRLSVTCRFLEFLSEGITSDFETFDVSKANWPEIAKNLIVARIHLARATDTLRAPELTAASAFFDADATATHKAAVGLLNSCERMMPATEVIAMSTAAKQNPPWFDPLVFETFNALAHAATALSGQMRRLQSRKNDQ